MTREEVYEPFYQFLGEPSNSEEWKTLRGLVDNIVAETERDTIDRVLEIINTVNDDLDFGTKEKGVTLSIKEKVLALKGEQG